MIGSCVKGDGRFGSHLLSGGHPRYSEFLLNALYTFLLNDYGIKRPLVPF